jgi:hypothetical protein
MKPIIAIAAALITAAPTVASADGGCCWEGNHWRGPARYSDHYDRGSRINPWPFIAGAVVGGIIVHSAEASQPRVVSSPATEAPVLVNGVWMQRTYRCTQEIVIDTRGDERLMQRCNYVYVPVTVSEK